MIVIEGVLGFNLHTNENQTQLFFVNKPLGKRTKKVCGFWKKNKDNSFICTVILSYWGFPEIFNAFID